MNGGPSRTARGLVLLAGILSLCACSHLRSDREQARVTNAFEQWKTAVIDQKPDQAIAYIPRHVDDYLRTLNTKPTPVPASVPAPVNGTAAAPSPDASRSPGVDLLLRRAIEAKVPPDLRANLTLAALFQRISDRHLFNPHDVRQIEIGHIAVTGDRAEAEVYYDGTLTALRLPFIKEDDTWKIDVMSILPYAEVLLRLDRAVKGETQSQQVDQLVAKLPSL